VNLARLATTPGLAAASGGGSLSISGTSISQGGHFELPSGVLTLTATTGNVSLLDGSLIDARGYTRRLGDVDLYGPAGTVNLVAPAGNVVIDPGAAIDVSNTTAGDAGTINVTAGGALAGTGSLAGGAASGYRGGSFTADLGSAPDLGVLSTALNA